MKLYPVVDLTSDPILSPAWPENSRPVSWVTQLVVHHSGTFRSHDYDNLPLYQSEAQYQNAKSIPGSKGLMYHYKIDNQGTISHVRPHNVLLWHDGNFPSNQHSIAICIDGNFQEQTPTQEQFEALKQLLDNLCTQHPEFPASQGDVYPHRHFSATSCCGDNLVPWIEQYRNSGGNVAIPQVGYDWAELQPNYIAPVVEAPIEVPVEPMIEEPNVIPISDAEKSEYEVSFEPFKDGSKDMTLTVDTQAVDFSSQNPPKVKSVGWVRRLIRFLLGSIRNFNRK
jgi:hypothetical protein